MDEQEQAHRSMWLQHVYTRGGWMRTLPPGAIAILGPLIDGPKTFTEIDAELRLSKFTPRGWQSEAWEPLHVWTDEELAEQRADPILGDAGDEADAATVNAEDAARRAGRLAELERFSQHLNVAPVRTLADLMEFMVACRILTRADHGDDIVLDFAADPPLPAEVLPLSDEQRAEEDQLRWRHAHEPTAGSIMRLFTPDSEDRPTQMRTSLVRLAHQLDTDVEAARAGVLLLLEDGDFTASRDVERILEHQVFELAVDWMQFDRSRLHIRFATPEETAD